MVQFGKWKIALVIAACLWAVLYSLPNVLGKNANDWMSQHLPSFLPTKTVNLGLDLQGGSYLLLQVDMNSVVNDRMNAVLDGARTALRAAHIGYLDLGVQGQSVTFTVRDQGELDAARQAVAKTDNQLVVTTGDGNKVTAKFSDQALQARETQALQQSIEIVRRRIDATGTREPTIERQGNDRIVVQLPGLSDPEHVKHLLGQTAKLSFQLLDDTTSPADAQAGRIPPGSELLPSSDGSGRAYVVRKRVMVSGDTLVDAQPSFENGQPVVSFRFDSVGARRFADVTRANVGRPFAIVLDGKVISAPVIREPITGGSGVISGNFTVQSAQDLALLLRAGALPAPLHIIEQRTVGAGLGADSIRAGKIASVVGLVLVIVFMFASYGFFGLMANVALLFNMAMIFAALSILQATLTLPGIAGIVLTIGLAVDANVLVFERIREEFRAGRSVISSIDAGYSRAFTTIVDSNTTTLIASILLYIFGSGPVRGFAVTLGLGIVTSVFAAIMITRFMVLTWMRRTRPKAIPI